MKKIVRCRDGGIGRFIQQRWIYPATLDTLATRSVVKLRTILHGKYTMSYYVYVIKSVNTNYTYTWMTNNIERRLEEHNLWKTKSNKNYKPFELIYLEEVKNSLEARKREKYLKWWNWRKWLKNKLENVSI